MTDIETLASEMERTRREIEKLRADTKTRRYAIKHDEDMTGEQKEIRLRQLAQQSQDKHRRLAHKWKQLTERADLAAPQARNRQPVDEAATTRVRELLKGGMADSVIIERAIKLGDDDALEALRRERQWHNDGKSFSEASDTINAIDRALSEMGRGEGQRDMNRALVRIDEVRKPMATLVEVAGRSRSIRTSRSTRFGLRTQPGRVETMPEGQWSFLDSKGPRKKLTLMVSPEAYVLLKAAASSFGTTPTGQAQDVVERWAENFLARHADALAAGVTVERKKRAGSRSRVKGSTSSDRSVHGDE